MGGLVGDFTSGFEGLLGGNPNGAGTVAANPNLTQPVTSSQVYEGSQTADQALGQQKDLIGALAAQNGIGNQSSVFNQEQNLANQYGNIAAGNGPNPAQAALNQSTGQNIAAQAAEAAGQRGASSNVGLIARQVGQQGGAIQQQAVGQGATLQAQQELAALAAQGNQQNNLANLATTQVGQQTGAVNNYNNSTLTNQNQLLNALQGYNSNLVGANASANSANAGIAEGNAKNTAGLYGGVINAIGGEGKVAAAAKGGDVKDDGSIGSNARMILSKAVSQKEFPEHFRSIAQIYHPNVIKKMNCGGQAMSEGAVVPGNPKVPGKNTLKNDVVPAMLTPKEIVLPLSVTQAKNPGEAAKSFVEHIKGKDSKDSDFKRAVKDHIKKRKSRA